MFCRLKLVCPFGLPASRVGVVTGMYCLVIGFSGRFEVFDSFGMVIRGGLFPLWSQWFACWFEHIRIYGAQCSTKRALMWSLSSSFRFLEALLRFVSVSQRFHQWSPYLFRTVRRFSHLCLVFCSFTGINFIPLS